MPNKFSIQGIHMVLWKICLKS